MPNRPSNGCLVFYAVLGAVAAGALAIRVANLERRPMHHDEANQAVRCKDLLEKGEYTYDPNQHHGPTLYYFSLIPAWLQAGTDFSQTTETTFRIVPVVFGVGILGLLLLVRDGLGKKATLAAAVITALSPAMVYYSRFYIQETLLVFFTFAAIATGWRYLKTRRIGWAIALGASLAFMHATKETCVIAFAAMAFALGLWALLNRKKESLQDFWDGFHWWHAAALFGGAFVVWVTLY